MSQRRFRIIIIFMILSSSIISFMVTRFYVMRAVLQEDGYRDEVVKLLNEVKPVVEDIRGLPAPDEIGVEVLTMDWVKENWGTKYYESISEEVEIDEEIYKSLFLMPMDESLMDRYVGMSGFTAGILEDTLYVVRGQFDPYEEDAREIVVHELTHTIQGKHFKTPEMELYDEKQAWSALIEGDAIYTGRKFTEKWGSQTKTVNQTKNSPTANLQSTATGRQKINALSRLRMFPYNYGEEFIDQLFKEDGWRTVNNAYLNPPITTEQIMHPSKYVKKEAPKYVDEPVPIGSEKWKLERRDRMGEYFVSVVLANWLPSTMARLASEGWGGDDLKYLRYGDQCLLQWVIVWDTVQDASEFYDSFNMVLSEVGGVETDEIDGVLNANASLKLWKVNWGYMTTSLTGDTTTIIGSSSKEVFLQSFIPKIMIEYGSVIPCLNGLECRFQSLSLRSYMVDIRAKYALYCARG